MRLPSRFKKIGGGGDRINLVGLELEGGWTHKEAMKLVETRSDGVKVLPFHHDASLRDDPLVGADHYGEVISPPLALSAAKGWAKERWPSAVNTWCGFHVHMSFKTPGDYQLLMEEKFWKFFLVEIEKWARGVKLPDKDPFWPRLAGRNRYCVKKFLPGAQVSLTTKTPGTNRATGEQEHPRRAMLNYAWAMHKTLECRLFPMWSDVEVAMSALDALANIYNSYLKQADGKVESSVMDFSLGKDLRLKQAEPRRRAAF